MKNNNSYRNWCKSQFVEVRHRQGTFLMEQRKKGVEEKNCGDDQRDMIMYNIKRTYDTYNCFLRRKGKNKQINK